MSSLLNLILALSITFFTKSKSDFDIFFIDMYWFNFSLSYILYNFPIALFRNAVVIISILEKSITIFSLKSTFSLIKLNTLSPSSGDTANSLLITLRIFNKNFMPL